MGSVGQGTHCTLAWSLVHTPLPEVPVWKDQVSPCPLSYLLGALTDTAYVTAYPRVPYPAACYQTSLHLSTLPTVSRSKWVLMSCCFSARLWLRAAPTKDAMFCMKTGAFSSGFTLGAANSIRKEKTVGGLLFLALPWQDSSELILEIKIPGKGVSLTCIYVDGMRRHLYDFSTSIICLSNYWLCNLIICRSCVTLFPYEKGT